MTTESRPTVSVIIPIHDRHRHLARCLRSLLSQTYPAIETVVVDLCGTDSSSAKARHVMAGKTDVSVVRHHPDTDMYGARHAGIEKAAGRFVTFLEADDWLEPRAVQTMVETMTEYGADMVQIRNRENMKGVAVKYQERFDPALAGRLIADDEFRSLASYVGIDSYIHPDCRGKLYRADRLREAPRMEHTPRWGEDHIFNIQYLRECRTMVFSNYVGYNCRWSGQASSAYRYSALSEYKQVYQLKRMLGQDEGLIATEIRALLRHHVRSLITELGYTRDAVEMILADELRDPLWRGVGVTETAAGIVEAEHADIQRNPMRYLLKRLLR